MADGAFNLRGCESPLLARLEPAATAPFVPLSGEIAVEDALTIAKAGPSGLVVGLRAFEARDGIAPFYKVANVLMSVWLGIFDREEAFRRSHISLGISDS